MLVWLWASEIWNAKLFVFHNISISPQKGTMKVNQSMSIKDIWLQKHKEDSKENFLSMKILHDVQYTMVELYLI